MGRGLAVVLLLGLARLAVAHEPVFGVGARTLWRGGYGMEWEWEEGARWHLSYGWNENFTLGVEVAAEGKARWGAKWRFYRRDARRRQDSVSVFVRAPKGKVGFALAREDWRYYVFADWMGRGGGLAAGARLGEPGYEAWDPVVLLEVRRMDGWRVGVSLFLTKRNAAIKVGYLGGETGWRFALDSHF